MTEITPARMRELADEGPMLHLQSWTVLATALRAAASALEIERETNGATALLLQQARATLAARDALLVKAERFRVDEDTAIETRGDDTWAIVRRGAVLNRDGEWEHEPMPSHRSDEFIARTRYSLGEALDRALAAEIAAALGGNDAA